jgi:hypothetical protein
MESVYSAVNMVHEHGPRGRSAPDCTRPPVCGSAAHILLREGVCCDLIEAIHRRSSSQDRVAVVGASRTVASWVVRWS